jgi:hypothetical protein
MDVELGEDTPQMVAHRLAGDRKLRGNLEGRKAGGDQLEDFELARRQLRLWPTNAAIGRKRPRVERENENTDDLIAGAEREMLRTHPAQMPVAVDEAGLEVGRLAALRGATELLSYVRAQFGWYRLGEVVPQQLGARQARGALGGRVHVDEPAGGVVQACGDHKVVDQPQVDILPTMRHRAPIVDQLPETSQQRNATHVGGNADIGYVGASYDRPAE